MTWFGHVIELNKKYEGRKGKEREGSENNREKKNT
jgi:hypothetical protein